MVGCKSGTSRKGPTAPADIDRNQLIEEDKRYRREVAKKNAAKAAALEWVLKVVGNGLIPVGQTNICASIDGTNYLQMILIDRDTNQLFEYIIDCQTQI